MAPPDLESEAISLFSSPPPEAQVDTGGAIGEFTAFAGAGRPEFSSSDLTPQQRINEFLKVRAAGLASDQYGENRDPAPVLQELERRFPQFNKDAAAGALSDEYRRQLADKNTTADESFGGAIARRSLPFVSSIVQARETRQAQLAQERIAAGKPNPGDYETLATFTKRQERAASQGFGGQVMESLAAVPAMLGEAYVGGKIIGGLANIPRTGTQALIQAERVSSPAARLLAAAGKTAAITPTMPSMYLPDMARRAMEGGGDPTDLRNMAPAVGHAYLMTGVLSAVGGVGKKVGGEGIGGYLKRLGAGAGVGVAGSQAAKIPTAVVDDIMGVRSDYGALGEIAEGKVSSALQHLAVEAITFGVFGLFHTGLKPEHGGPVKPMERGPVFDAFKEALDYSHSRGLSDKGAAAKIDRVHGRFKEALEAKPEMTREEARTLFEGDTSLEPAYRKYGLALADTVPERSPAPQPSGPGKVTSDLDPITEALGKGPAIKVEDVPAEAPKAEAARLEAEPVTWKKSGTKFEDDATGATVFTGRDGARYRIEHSLEDAPPNTAEFAGQKRVQVRVYDQANKEAGHVDFYQTKDGAWMGEGLKAGQKSGVARAMYDSLAEMGERIVPNSGRTAEGKAFWDKNQAATTPTTPPATQPGALPAARPEEAPSPAKVTPPENAPRMPQEAPPIRPAERAAKAEIASPDPRIEPKPLTEAEVERAERARIEAQGEKPASDPSLKPVQARTPEELRARYEAGEFRDVREVLEAAGLDARERHIIEQRLSGRSQAKIGADPQLGREAGKPYTRERVRQLEKQALAKTGIGKSIEKVILAAERAERAADKIGRGQQVTPQELGADPKEVERVIVRRKDALEKADTQLEQLSKRYIKEAERGPISPERAKEYEREVARILQQGERANQEEAQPIPRVAREEAKAPDAAPAAESVTPPAPAVEEAPRDLAGIKDAIRTARKRGVGPESMRRSAEVYYKRPIPEADYQQALQEIQAYDKLTPAERMAAARQKSGSLSEWQKEEERLSAGGQETLASWIREQGGLSKKSARENGLDLKRLAEEGIPESVFRDAKGRPGKAQLDEIMSLFIERGLLKGEIGEEASGKMIDPTSFMEMVKSHQVIARAGGEDAFWRSKMEAEAREEIRTRLSDEHPEWGEVRLEREVEAELRRPPPQAEPGEAFEGEGRSAAPGPLQEVAPGVAFAGFPFRFDALDRLLRGGGSMVGAVRKWLGKMFRTRGDRPESVEALKNVHEGKIAGWFTEIKAAERDLKAAVGYYEHAPADKIERINDALGGDARAMKALPAEVRDVVKRMRDTVDLLSTELQLSGAIDAKLEGTFDANLGFYLNRSYRVFNEATWAKDVRERHPEIVNRFKDWLRGERQAANLGTSEAELDAVVNMLLNNNTAAENPIAFLKASKLGSKDLGILARRKDVPAPLRALWGEYTDPLVNFANTVGKQAHLLHRHLFLKEAREAGLREGWLRTEADGPLGDVYMKLAPEGSKVMDPMNGMLTTPEIKKAFEEYYSKRELSAFGKWYARALGLTKYAKTVGSPITHIRNFVSNGGFAMANGHWRVSKFSDVWQAMVKDTPEAREYYKMLVERGIIGQGVHYGEFRDWARDVLGSRELEADLAPGERMGRMSERRVLSWLKKGLSLAEKTYHAEDTVWKVFAFENEVARYQKAYPEWSKEQVQAKAAEIVKDTYPTYSMLPAAVKGIRRFPLVGPFVSFPAEVIRTGWKTARLAFAELSDPRTRGIGAERLAGMMMAVAAPMALVGASRLFSGVTEDQEEAMRRFLPPWTRNSQLLHMGQNDKGERVFIDLGYSDPHAYLRKPLMALLRGEPLEAGREAATPFVSEELLTGKLLDVARPDAGRVKGYNPRDPLLADAGKKAAHVAEAFTPGAVDTLRRGDLQAANLAGQRVQALDLPRSLGFKARAYKRDEAAETGILRKPARSKDAQSDSDLVKAWLASDGQRRKTWEAMREDVLAAQKLGLSDRQVRDTLRGAGLSQQAVSDLVTGRYRPEVPDVSLFKGSGLSPEEMKRRAGVIRRVAVGE